MFTLVARLNVVPLFCLFLLKGKSEWCLRLWGRSYSGMLFVVTRKIFRYLLFLTLILFVGYVPRYVYYFNNRYSIIIVTITPFLIVTYLHRQKALLYPRTNRY